ncbi:MAG: translocation/assembly module TamB domain-containing protein [Gemmatimonadota bacterium]
MTWKERLIGIPLAIVGAVLLLAMSAGMGLTRTDWGRERVRSYALQKLNNAIQGRVEIDAVLEGDLLRMVRMAGVRIYEPDGSEFARIDTVTVHYRWSAFLLGNITLAGVELVGPVVQLSTSAEGGWNFSEVFSGRDTAATEAEAPKDEGRRRRIVLRDVAIRSGDVTIRMPWQPDGTDPDSARWHLEQVDGGWQRVFRIERLNASLPTARVEAPEELGRLFQAAQLSCRATIIGEPIEVEQLRADIEVHGDTLSFQVWEGVLPSSRLFGRGWVTLTGDPEYDLELHANPVTTDDIMWLVPSLPPGVADVDFRFLSLRNGISLEATNARWESPDARLSGRFAMTLRKGPDGLRFDDVDLDIERLTTALIDSLTGWTAPIPAVLTGRVSLDGPLSDLQVDADVYIEPDTLIASSHVIAIGTVHAGRDGLGAGNLELQLDTVQLDLVRAFVPGLALRGELDGRARLDGRLADGLTLDFEIEQRDGRFVPTHLSGGGTITANGTSPLRLDVNVTGDPFSLTTLSEYFPAIPFRGEFRGEFSAVGPLDDLDVVAHLVGSGDSLRASGNLRLAADPPRYRGEIQGWRVSLPEFREGLAASDLDFRVEFEARGATLQELEAQGRADLFASFVGGVGFDSAVATLRIANGRLLVDTIVVKGEFGELRASGALGLLPEERDSLRFELQADSLGALNPWFFPTLEALAAPALLASASASTAPAEAPRVEGSARVEGWIVAEAGNFAVRGRVVGQRLTYRDLVADSFSIDDLDVGDYDEGLRARGAVQAKGVGMGRLRFDQLALRLEHADNRTTLEFDIAKEGAAVAGRIRSSVEGDARTIGLDSLTLQLGSSRWVLAGPATVHLAGSGAIAVDGLEVASATGFFEAGGLIEATGPTLFRAEVDGADLAEIATLWSDSAGVAGILKARAELSGRAEDPSLQGEFELVDGRLAGVDFTSFRGSIDFQSGDAAVEISMWQGETRMFRLYGTMPVDLALPGLRAALPERAIDLTLEGDSVPLTLASLITDQISELQGQAEGTIYIRGTPKALDLDGPARLTAGVFRVNRTGILYGEVEGPLEFSGNVLELKDVVMRGSPTGRGTVRGTITFTTLSNPEFALTLDAEELPAYDQLDAYAVVSGTVRLRGRYERPTVDGDLSVVSGVMFVEEIGRQQEIVDLFEEGFTLLGEMEEVGRPPISPFLENLTMDLGLKVEQDTWLRSAEMNVEIAGDLTVRMEPGQEEWRIDGTLQAVRGDYRLFNKRFEVTEGTIDFVGDMNPGLNISALYTVQTQKQPIEIKLRVGGTLEDMTLVLDSDHQPKIPESDLLSYLLFGRPSYELTRTSQERNLLDDVTSGVPQAFLGYALSSLLVGEAGIAYVDISRVTPTTTEGEYRSGVGPALAATQVEVGWYLAPAVFVSVAQHLVGAVRPTVRLDWRLDERLTLRGITEPRFGREGVLYYGGPGRSLEQSIGVFLLYGWAY